MHLFLNAKVVHSVHLITVPQVVTIQTQLFHNKQFCHTMQNHCARYNNCVVLLNLTPFEHISSSPFVIECHLRGDN